MGLSMCCDQIHIQQCKICGGGMESHSEDCPYSESSKLKMAAELASFGFRVSFRYDTIFIANQEITPMRAFKALKLLRTKNIKK